jgi:hypothetical protein
VSDQRAFSASPEAVRFIRRQLYAPGAARPHPGLVPRLFVCFEHLVMDGETGRVNEAESVRQEHCVVCWGRPGGHVVDLSGTRVFVHPGSLAWLQGKRLALAEPHPGMRVLVASLPG